MYSDPQKFYISISELTNLFWHLGRKEERVRKQAGMTENCCSQTLGKCFATVQVRITYRVEDLHLRDYNDSQALRCEAVILKTMV